MGRKERPRKKLSFGSVFMLCALGAVLLGSLLVLGRLYSGAKMDLSRLSMQALAIRTKAPETIRDAETQASREQPKQQVAATPAQAAEPAVREFRLTLGGTVALNGEVRKNSWSTDAKVTDYSDMMMLLAPAVTGDVKAVFLENMLSDRDKTSDTVAPSQAADLLADAGFNAVACGFSQAYANGREGIEDTLGSLESRDILPLGIGNPEDSPVGRIISAAGVKTAFLQYTGTVSASVRKKMEKEEAGGWIPEAKAELIAEDIARARENGAEAVIVMLENGRNGREPDQKMKNLAQEAAQAGADMIVSNGSLVPQKAERLTGRDGRQVLWVWSLGTLLGGDRSNIRHMSGYLLHVTVRSDGKGGAEILNPEYTPVYTWKYRQDGRYYYRCVVSDGPVPDGMDSEQTRNMARSAEIVAKTLAETGIPRQGENP